MVVSVLALTVALANPAGANPAGADPVGACAQDIACIAEPARPFAPVSVRLNEGAISNLGLEYLTAFQEEPTPGPASGATAPETVATVEDEPQSDGSDTGNVIVVEGAIGTPVGDPAEKLNAASYKAVQAVDQALVEPIAKIYDEALPSPIRKGLGNFLRNLGEPVSFLNFMLQMKPGKAIKTLGRFAINTTIGVAGVFDVAKKKPFNMPYEFNGLANTLGYYGVGPGPYLYLPFIGSTTVRDLFGRIVDLSIIPAVAGKPFNKPYYALPVGALTSLEARIETDAQIDAIRQKCGDPYAANRDLYLIERKVAIDRLRGRVTANLGEMQERLEFNCDIEIETGVTPKKGEGFVKGATTLLDEEDPATMMDDANVEMPVTANPVVEPEADLQAEPVPEIVTEETDTLEPAN
ncbi:VacJ family lipoprotein [Croceicoccus ponticola]|nr:VacJ family lipoprotein [Croceicoccus ponticola]